jgi:hypothetical protein
MDQQPNVQEPQEQRSSGGSRRMGALIATAAAVAVGGWLTFSMLRRSPSGARATPPSGAAAQSDPRSKTLYPAQRPDVSYMSRNNRNTVTEALVTLARLSPLQTRLLQGALHFHGKDIFGALKPSFSQGEVLAAVESHTGTPAAISPKVIFKFRSGTIVTLSEEESRVDLASGNSYMFLATNPLDHPGRLTPAEFQDNVRAIRENLSVQLTPQQVAALRGYLTKREALLDPNEDVVEWDHVLLYGHSHLKDPQRTRLEFFNGAVLEMQPDGKVVYEYLPWTDQ